MDDTGALKAAYYGADGSYEPYTGSSSGSSGGNILSTIGSALGAINPVLGVAGSLLGGILGNNAQKKANQANIAMQRETNALQYRMFNESNAFTKEMWNAQNEYNTPEKQAERLKAAGINPAFVFGNGSMTPASSVSSASAPSMTAPHVDPYNPMPAAQTAVDAYMQSQINNAQIKNMHENERHLSIQNELDTMQLLDKVNSLRIDNKQKELLKQFLFETFNAQKDAITKNNLKLDAETDNLFTHSAQMRLYSALETAKVDSYLRMNEKQMWQIAQVVAQHWSEIAQEGERIRIYDKSVQAQNAFLGNQAIHFLNEDAAAFEGLGLDKELLGSKKFSNYVGGTLGVALGAILAPWKSAAGSLGRTVVRGFSR